MSDRTYTQAEADALIAGAYLAAAAVTKDHVGFGYVEDRKKILALTPDAARLALEERELEVEKLNYHIKALFEEIQRMKTETAEREAKLIADTLRAAAEAQCLCCGELKDLWHPAEFDKRHKQYIHRSRESGKFGSMCDASKIHSITSVKIAAQAVERDRRVVYQFVQEILDKKRELYEIGSRESEAIQFVLNSLAHRAAVQEKPKT